MAYYASMLGEGHKLVFRESWNILVGLFRRRPTKKARRRTWSDMEEADYLQEEEEDQLEDDDGDQDPPVTILYGAHVWSSLEAIRGHWATSFILDVRHGLEPSATFIIGTYCLFLLGFFAADLIAYKVLQPTLLRVMPGLVDGVYRLLARLFHAEATSYVVFSILNVSYMIYQRQFIRQFFLGPASLIRLPRSSQRRLVYFVFMTTTMYAFCSEPLFAAITIHQDFKQPNFWPQLGELQFKLARYTVMVVFTWAANLLSSLCYLGFSFTAFILLATDKHLESLFGKQVARYNKGRQRVDRRQHNPQLRSLVDGRLASFIRDYSCATLTMDWPEMNTMTMSCCSLSGESLANKSLRRARQANKVDKVSWQRAQDTPPAKSVGARGPRLDGAWSPVTVSSIQGCSAYGSLLLLYKNLVKCLSELRQLREMYEARFGMLHVALICLNGFHTAQWVMMGVVQSRLIEAKLARDGHADEVLFSIDGMHVTPFTFRVGVGVIAFFISNTHLMMACHRLADRICKIKSQLFKMNIELVMWSLSNGQTKEHHRHLPLRYKQQGPLDCASSSEKCRRKLDQDNCNLLNLIWAMYDQVVRIGDEANFRLAPRTFYNKKCLLTIFGREISFILLYIQIIDIFSTTDHVWSQSEGCARGRCPIGD